MNTLPTTITVGATANYVLTLPGYPASDGWTVTLYLNGAATTYNAVCTASGDDYLLQVPAATTGGWVAGDYAWELRATLGSDSYPVGKGQIRLVPGLVGAAAGADTRTPNQVALDDAIAAYAAWNPTISGYRIAGREMTFSSRGEILQKINFFQSRVKAEQANESMKSGRPNPRKLQVRMGRA